MDQIDYEFAPSDPEIYNNLLFGPFPGHWRVNRNGELVDAVSAGRELLHARC